MLEEVKKMILINAQIDYIVGESKTRVGENWFLSSRYKRILFDIFNWDSL